MHKWERIDMYANTDFSMTGKTTTTTNKNVVEGCNVRYMYCGYELRTQHGHSIYVHRANLLANTFLFTHQAGAALVWSHVSVNLIMRRMLMGSLG